MGITTTQWGGSYYSDLARSGFESMVGCFPNEKSEMGNRFVGEYVLTWNILSKSKRFLWEDCWDFYDTIWGCCLEFQWRQGMQSHIIAVIDLYITYKSVITPFMENDNI